MLTANRLRDVLKYNKRTGVFTWTKNACNRFVGLAAGHVNSEGYVGIVIDGKHYKAHRLAWLYVTGAWPPDQIDHRNTAKADNRWTNIRLSTNLLNTQNKIRANKNNKTGLLGVSPHRGSFQASITLKGKQIYLGIFSTSRLAYAAYIASKRKIHQGCTL